MLYLASASPRRAELLRQIDVEHTVRPAHVDETQKSDEAPDSYVCRIALAKAEKIAEELGDRLSGSAVLAADTTVTIDGEILGKPQDSSNCNLILQKLSGRTHDVLTAVVVISDHGVESKLSCSRVRFRQLTRQETEAYCLLPEPMDKAGAYAIQGLAAVFVEELQGSYSGVMGLPLLETAELLNNANIKVLD